MTSENRFSALSRTFAGRKVLVTGHTGFRGAWLSRWLLDLGAELTGFAREQESTPALFGELLLAHHMDSRIGDIRDADRVARVVAEARPEIVFHLAAQPLVVRSYAEPRATFETNVLGTVNVFEAVRNCDATRAVINVTSDEVYGDPETDDPLREDDPLGGYDPHSASEACSELVTLSFRRSFFAEAGLGIATARSGNAIGGGDWSDGRIVPDIVRALAFGEPVRVRRPDIVRPWQHVLDPLSGWLTLAAALHEHGESASGAYNFGPEPDDVHSVRELVEALLSAWGVGEWDHPDGGEELHEAGMIRLDISKAREVLGWKPTWGFETAIERTVTWYRRVGEGESATAVTQGDLAAFAASQ